MKILFINQFFWPDSSATSQQLTDLATGLAERGHDISVLCGNSDYAEPAAGQQPPVHIYRVPALPFGRGGIGRMLSYLTFYLFAFLRGFTIARQDVVVSMTTPPLISLLGSLHKLLRGSRHFIWEQDMYPDVAIDLNYVKPGGLTDRVTGYLADIARQHADGVIALGECMKQRLMSRGIPASKVVIAENWANSAAIEPMPRPGNPDELVLLYSGNLGLAHDLHTLTNGMRLLREDKRFRFLFVGGGGHREELENYCVANSVESVEFRPYVARELLGESLAAGDIGIVTQRQSCCGSVVPSKVYGILAAGRPVLFIGPRTATPARIVERHQCGWQIDCGDEFALRNLLLHLAENPTLVHEAGARARKALLDHYDIQPSIDRIAAILNYPNPTPKIQENFGFAPTAPGPQHRARS